MLTVVMALPSGQFALRDATMRTLACECCLGPTITGGTIGAFRVYTQDHDPNCISPASVFSQEFLHEEDYRGDIAFLKCGPHGDIQNCDEQDLDTVRDLVNNYMDQENRE